LYHSISFAHFSRELIELMADTIPEPIDAMTAFLSARYEDSDSDQTPSRRAAYQVGESAAFADMTIEETFELLERDAIDIIADLSAEILGSIVRGYVDQVVRTRGLAHRKGSGRLSSHVARLSALHRINRAATGSLDLDSMLSTVVGVIAETISGDACSVFLYEAHSQTLMLRASVGLNPDVVGRLSIRSDAGITGLAAVSRQTQIVVDAPAHPAFFTYPNVGEDKYTSQVSLPLLLGEPERLVGVLNIQSIRPREFDQDEITFLETAAGELAIAIENARLYGQTDAALHQRIMDLDALRSVTRSFASTLQSDELLPLIASQALVVTGGDASTICRSESGVDEPLHVACLPDTMLDPEQRFPTEFVRDVCRTGSGLVTSNAANGTSGTLLLGAPLMTGHGVLGAVCVSMKGTVRQGESKLGLLQAFADSAALAIENADLYAEARHGYETASILLQEMHHRVRNNLQTVAALLSMQSRHAGYSEWSSPLREAVARIQSIAAVHNLLSSDNVTSAPISSIAKHVVDEASINVVPPSVQITFTVTPTKIEALSKQATILALLINECVTNAIEHGYANRESGTIAIHTDRDNGFIQVTIEDDGEGLREDFDLERDSQLGLRIARTLATSDLKGSFELLPRSEGGTRSVIRFPAHA
jgi:two-component system, sensor histidine kinase PdtaS